MEGGDFMPAEWEELQKLTRKDERYVLFVEKLLREFQDEPEILERIKSLLAENHIDFTA